MNKMKLLLGIAAVAVLAASPLVAHEGHDDKEGLATGETKKITGEVVDMACYVDHNATGEKHADCAKRCITSGLPVGLKADDGKTYLLIGEHKSLNSELAEYAAKKITVEGKIVSRDGIYMIENAIIMK
jgi:type 1 fimbria pilin